MPSCCVPGCLVTKYDGVPMHKFPNFVKYPDLFNKWVNAVGGNSYWLDQQYVRNNLRVCRKHFRDIYLYPRSKLCGSAIPELLLSGKSGKVPKSSSDNKPLLTDTCVPTSETKVPASETKVPASETKVPASETKVPASETRVPASETRVPASETKVPASKTRVPASETRVPASKTRVPASETKVRASETKVPASETRVPASDTCLPHLYTEDALDDDDPGDLDFSEHNYTKKPTLSGIRKTAVDEPTGSLSAPTSPSPELPAESSDKKLDGFKVGVSEKVLQFRLVDDGDCDEPIYKVLTEEKPETKEKTNACSTEHDAELQEEPSTTKDDDIENEPEPKESVTKYEKHKDKEYWKLKLTHILHKTKFCGICLNAEDGMNEISDEVEIVNCEITYRNTLRHIVDRVFKEIDYPLANSQVCESCTKKLIQSYMFIRGAKDTAKVLNYHLDELYNKTCYIRNNDLKRKQAGSEIYNVVIALDKEIPKGFDCDIALDEEIPKDFDSDIALDEDIPKDFDSDIALEEEIPKDFDSDIALDEDIPKDFDCDTTPEEPRTSESKLNRPRAKRKLKCVSCNVILPSQRAWRVHETTTHRDNLRCPICLQSFRTRQNFTEHYRTHLYSRCAICHRTVQDGGLLQHLKRRHRRSVHLCSKCDVAFYSAETLARHEKEHHGAGARCATCLLSVPRGQHRCRFSCPTCDSASCEHVQAYRQQALNLTHRLACVDCRYVCRSGLAFEAHVDAIHGAKPRSSVATSERVCEYCDKRFSKEATCQRHRKECKRIQRQYQCDCCPANFDSSKNLMVHRERKHGKYMFSCDLCDRVFLNDRKKRKHLVLVHSGYEERDSSSVCVVCQKTFPTKAALLLHLRYHEPGTKFPCGVCRTQFDTVAQFSAHDCRRTRSLSMCEMCGQLVRQGQLKRHVRAHAGGAVSCDTCGRRFQNVTSLHYHQQRHLKNVACSQCNKSISSAKLWRHLRNHLIRDSYREKLRF